jgi:hypothetical protein
VREQQQPDVAEHDDLSDIDVMVGHNYPERNGVPHIHRIGGRHRDGDARRIDGATWIRSRRASIGRVGMQVVDIADRRRGCDDVGVSRSG